MSQVVKKDFLINISIRLLTNCQMLFFSVFSFFVLVLFGSLSLFNGISVFMGFLMQKPSLYKNSCGTIQPIARGIRGS